MIFLLIGNDIEEMPLMKLWLGSHFDMKDLREASYILRIRLLRYRNKKVIGLPQSTYIETILSQFNMNQAKKSIVTFQTRHITF